MVELNQHGNHFSSFWDYSVTQKKETDSVLVGELAGGHGGVLQLVQTEGVMDLIIIGNPGMAASKFGSIVALFDYYVVKEIFFKIEESSTETQKLYAVVKDSNFYLLEPKVIPSSIKEKTNYRLKLLSKSALTFHHRKMKDLSLCQFVDLKFFWGMATIMKLGLKGEVLEKWQRFVKFSGENTNLYPLLEVGDECELRIPSLLNPDIALRKSQTFHSMKYISEHECLLLPAEMFMTKISSEAICCGKVSVQQVVREGFNSELITVSGIVSCKKFEEPKFNSNICQLPLNICHEYHIGVPGSMNFKLLLQDESSPESEVWLYVTCSTNFSVTGYPLFVIPGIRILATDVRRVVAKSSKNVYLASSEFTRIIPLSVPESEQSRQTDTPSIFLKTVYSTLRNIPCKTDVFMIFGRVVKIMTATLRTVCMYCNHDLFEDSYCCENCFGSNSADVEVFLEVLVDDGSDTALVLLKGMKQLAVLLGLTKKEYTKLHNLIVSECLHLDYSAMGSQRSQNCKLEYLNYEDFKRMILYVDHEHSYRFICKKQESQHHLCLNVSPLTPMKDIEHLLKCN